MMMKILLLLFLALPLLAGCGEPTAPAIEEDVTGRIFYTERDAAGKHAICSIHPDRGGYARQLEGGILLARPAGGWMIYTMQGNDSRIMAARLNGSDARVIHEGKAKVELAPNGRIAACVSPDEIAIVDIATGAHRVIHGKTPGYAASFSPDSRYLAFSDGEEIHIAEAATGRSHRVITNELIKGFGDCFWSPAGDRILLSQRTATSGTILRFIDTTGTTAQGVAIDVDAFAWSPDGKKIAFTQIRQPPQLWVQDIAAYVDVLVCYSQIIPGSTLDWSADGNQLIFTFIDNTGREFLARANAVLAGRGIPMADRGYGAYSVR